MVLWFLKIRSNTAFGAMHVTSGALTAGNFA